MIILFLGVRWHGRDVRLGTLGRFLEYGVVNSLSVLNLRFLKQLLGTPILALTRERFYHQCTSTALNNSQDKRRPEIVSESANLWFLNKRLHRSGLGYVMGLVTCINNFDSG